MDYKAKKRKTYISKNRIEVDLNTLRGLKDVRYIVYKLVWDMKMKNLKEELFRLMVYWDGTGWTSRKSGESLFQFRDLLTSNTMDISTNSSIFKVSPSIGKMMECPIDDEFIVSQLPNNYYTHYTIEEALDKVFRGGY